MSISSSNQYTLMASNAVQDEISSGGVHNRNGGGKFVLIQKQQDTVTDSTQNTSEGGVMKPSI